MIPFKGSKSERGEQEARDARITSPLTPPQQRALARANLESLRRQKAEGIKPVAPEPKLTRSGRGFPLAITQRAVVRAPHPYANSAKGASILDFGAQAPAETSSTISLPAKTKRIL